MADENNEVETPVQQRQPLLKIKLPWGELQARGETVILTILIIICTGTAIMVYDRGIIARAEHLELSKDLRSFTEAVAEQSYILTLSTDRREKLGLMMPYSLCKKLGNRCGEVQ